MKLLNRLVTKVSKIPVHFESNLPLKVQIQMQIQMYILDVHYVIYFWNMEPTWN